MNVSKKLVLVSVASLLALPAAAQSEADHQIREREVRVEVETRMIEAERALEEAARRVAELSARQLASADEMQRFIVASNRPVIGVNISGNSGSDPVEGVAIASVSPGGPADDAGLRAGDIITGINGDSFSSENSMEASRLLLDFMSGVEEGDILEIDYLRNGSMATVQLQPKVMDSNMFSFRFNGNDMSVPVAPTAPGAPQAVYAYRWAAHGGHGFGDMEMVELNENLGRYFGTDSGLLIVKAPADNAFDLQDGDVIKSIDGREPQSLHHAVRILSSYESGETVNFEIMRDKRKQTLSIEVPDNRTSMAVPVPAVAPMSSAAPTPLVAPSPSVAPTPPREPTATFMIVPKASAKPERKTL